ncbi:O-acetyl-ADP-ribose deacetylase 1 [Portunus trituberculatus]|uniref:O-acetyl-ADP-ribose deacetylase 1 n=1 Tax=Portunus trituberculatus TaxID=210409 RepID=A0A5B7FL37_PORTR|nr:O-acetyl-ADP-ribose deacetylase 1 [Portunus trituberculatus]
MPLKHCAPAKASSSELKRKRKMMTISEKDGNGIIKKSKGNHVRSEGFAITEVRSDLFTCSDGTSLAHCISQDIRMGKGIAAHFKKTRMPHLVISPRDIKGHYEHVQAFVKGVLPFLGE